MQFGTLGSRFGTLGLLGGAGTTPGGSPYILAAGVGSFVLTGDDMTPLVDRILPADAGDFTLTGEDAAFDYTPSGGGFSIVPSVTGGVTDTTGGTAGVYTKSIDVGTYSVGRMIFVGVMARTNAALAPSSVTISGVAATLVTGSHANNSSSADTSVWYVDANSVGGPVTTSGSATIVVTFGTAPSRAGFSVYSVYGASASAPSGVTSLTNSPTTENTLAVPTGGTIMVFQFSLGGYPTTLSATNFTQDTNANIVTTQGYASLHSTAGALSGTPSVTVNATGAGTTTGALSFVSVGP